MAGLELNSTDCLPIDDYIKSYYLPVMYSIISVFGFVGNFLAVITYLAKLRPWKSSSIIMVNLAVADLLYALSLPMLVQFYITGNWILGEFMCRFIRFCFYYNLYGSILFLTCLSIFRYVAVVHPLKAAEMRRKRWGILACLAVWAVSLVEIGPMLGMITLRQKNNMTQCVDFASNNPLDVWWYGWILTMFGYVLPLLVVCWSYTHIAGALGSSISRNRPSRSRVRMLTILILVVFVVCFLPYHIMRVLRVDSLRRTGVSCMQRRGIHAAYILSRPLAGLNTFFNLALYTLAGDKFQQALWSFVHRERTSSTISVIHTPNNMSKTDLLRI
ncbi:2-oxoglutarate receptor 1 [Rhinichthys klamathensis goyatoka]|uniref:2-oxoglutarate receptor 1 n=1 Tax=Rhinichthys klamathensis goyatoka TaxID=3034132 RepID=UPI0024B49F45|nr:2-oxoglutarate receptor 1 [Rhinichthys klamathensis goyatoka]